ncbi:MAG TPA: glycoside hydrolase family 43 protein [Polyangiaceae bacterium]|nr:glycoside hydrolase family 43 protein [Polyangiaceae bacterium]
MQTSYTADPAPMVYEGRLYLYTSHDEDVTVKNFFTMNDWRLYSTVDMVNWTDHGSPASYKTFSWGTGDAWAPHGIARNGKFYLYVPLNNSTGSKIGVAVADSPLGPFKDALGKALIATGGGNIDPTVFIDDDNQAYLYWGNPDLWYVKLNSDMISYAGSPTKVNLTTAGFGTRSNSDRATAYEEGPWFYKRDALYYLVFPADGTPEKISYSTSSGPLGPWSFGGDIMAKQTGNASSFTNHPGVIDYKGKSYFFYHNAALPGGGGFKRSVCVEEFTYASNGKIPTIQMSKSGPAAVATLDPFQQVEAETIAFSSGLKTETCSDTGGGLNVTSISNGDYIKMKNVDFKDGVKSFEARVSSSTSNAKIELRLDSQAGALIGTCDVSGVTAWATKTCAVSGASSTHDLYLGFVGGTGDLFKFNSWKFVGSTPSNGGTGGTTGTTGGSAGNSSSGGSNGGVSGSTSAMGGTRAATGGETVSAGASGGASATGGSNAGESGSSSNSTAAGGGSSAHSGGASSGLGGGSGGLAAGGTGLASGNPGTPRSENGCGCRMSSRSSQSSLLASAVLIGLALQRRSGTRRRGSRSRSI